MFIMKRANLLYTVLLLLLGYGVSYFENQLFNGFGTLVWLIIFSILTLSFSSVRSLIVPLIDLNPFKRPITYLYILLGILIPYLLLKISLHFEILLDQRVIVHYRNGLHKGLEHYPLIEAVIFAPVWEELLFRGVLLYALLKVMKPIWAVVISSIIFSLFHPAYLFISLIAGVVLALVAIKTKSVLPSLVTHSIWNLYTGKLFLFL